MYTVFTATGYRKPKALMLLAMLFTCLTIAVAQEPVIGTVHDVSGSPVEGVSVRVQGTSRGAATDANGQFRVPASEGDVLTFSAVGYRPEELTLGSQRMVSVVLQLESSDLDERSEEQTSELQSLMRISY